MAKVKRGTFYRHNNDGRVYQVVGAGQNRSHNDEATVAFRQVLNASCASAIQDGEVETGQKCYFRSKESFVEMYTEVDFVCAWQPVNDNRPVAEVRNNNADYDDDYYDYDEDDDELY